MPKDKQQQHQPHWIFNGSLPTKTDEKTLWFGGGRKKKRHIIRMRLVGIFHLISFHFLTPSHCAGTSHGQCASLVQHHRLHLRTQLQWFGTTAHLAKPGGKSYSMENCEFLRVVWSPSTLAKHHLGKLDLHFQLKRLLSCCEFPLGMISEYVPKAIDVEITPRKHPKR